MKHGILLLIFSFSIYVSSAQTVIPKIPRKQLDLVNVNADSIGGVHVSPSFKTAWGTHDAYLFYDPNYNEIYGDTLPGIARNYQLENVVRRWYVNGNDIKVGGGTSGTFYLQDSYTGSAWTETIPAGTFNSSSRKYTITINLNGNIKPTLAGETLSLEVTNNGNTGLLTIIPSYGGGFNYADFTGTLTFKTSDNSGYGQIANGVSYLSSSTNTVINNFGSYVASNFISDWSKDITFKLKYVSGSGGSQTSSVNDVYVTLMTIDISQ